MRLLLTGLCCGLLLGGQIAAAVVHKDSPKVADLQEHNRILRYQVETGKVRQQRMVAQLSGNAPELVEVRSMENCQPCDRVLDKLKADGVTVTVKPTEIVTATSFPCCIYKSGDFDSGQNILHGNYCVTRQPIPVTKLVQK